MLEVSPDQTNAVAELMRDAGFTEVRTVKDGDRSPRVVCGRRN